MLLFNTHEAHLYIRAPLSLAFIFPHSPFSKASCGGGGGSNQATPPKYKQHHVHGHMIMITEHGHMIKEIGHMITENGHMIMITEHGHIIKEIGHMITEHGHMITEYGHMITEHGHMITAKWSHDHRTWSHDHTRTHKHALLHEYLKSSQSSTNAQQIHTPHMHTTHIQYGTRKRLRSV